MAREKPTQHAERRLIESILDGTYPPGSTLPGERDLCRSLGVARPALREALQRLAREGWLDIQQGKATQVRDFLRQGNLNLLPRILEISESFSAGLVPDLLEMWLLLAPTYTRRAMERAPEAIGQLLAGYAGLPDRASDYTRAQWLLHRTLLDRCGNRIYGLILNTFGEYYQRMAPRFYTDPQARAEARSLWQALYSAALDADGEGAAHAMQVFMESNHQRWWERIAPRSAEELSTQEGEETHESRQTHPKHHR